MDGFEVFEKPQRGRVTATRPMVSIQKSGSVVLNPLAAQLIDKPAVQFAYNAKAKKVALIAVDKNSPNAYTLRELKSGAKTVGGRSFLESVGIAHEKATSYEVEQSGDMLVLS